MVVIILGLLPQAVLQWPDNVCLWYYSESLGIMPSILPILYDDDDDTNGIDD